MEFAGLSLVAGRNFFMGPRTVSDGAFEQSTIFEFIRENRFEEVQVRNGFGIFQARPIITNAGGAVTTSATANRSGSELNSGVLS